MSFSHKRKASRLVCWASLLISFALLIIPSFAGFMDLDYLATVDENRVFAPPPSWPANWTEFLALPRQVDNYLRDHFGFRAYLLQANANARYALFNETPTPQTIFGHDGRLFLTTHDKASPYSLMSDICGARLPPAVINAAASGIRTLLRAARVDAPDALFVIIPTAPTIYAEDLPDWLARQCAGPRTAERIIQDLSADPPLASRVLYPVDALKAAKAGGLVIPRYNFHWSGLGTRATAAMIAEHVLRLRPMIDIPNSEQIAVSDLDAMIPGLSLTNRVVWPDYEAAGLQFCFAQPKCLPDLGDDATIITDYSRTLSPRAGSRRLLLITDSFGAYIAPWFAAYFGEVWHVSTNNLDYLSIPAREKLRETLFVKYRPDNVIFLYHDGAILYAAQRAAGLLWPLATPKP